jgi:hypothetical protein
VGACSDPGTSHVARTGSIDGGKFWLRVDRVAPWSPRANMIALMWSNNLWLMGGMNLNDAARPLMNDLWTTTDGVTWMLRTSKVDWSARAGFAAAVLTDNSESLMVMAGGFQTVPPESPGFGYIRDMWISGALIVCEVRPGPWATRCDLA